MCWKVVALTDFLRMEMWGWDFLHTNVIKHLILSEHWLAGKLQRAPEYWTLKGILKIDKHDGGLPHPQPANQRLGP
jgi:hypothetical protein